nr:MAG TPA: hypothetical protein [Caudoviricetes sp.]
MKKQVAAIPQVVAQQVETLTITYWKSHTNLTHPVKVF